MIEETGIIPTVILYSIVCPATVAVTTAFPEAIPVITPLLFTVTLFVFELAHVTVLLSVVSDGSIVYVNVAVLPLITVTF